jgi:hypothetical protein
VAEVVEHPPSKTETLSSKPQYHQKKKKGIYQKAGHWWLTLLIVATQEDHSLKPVQANSLQDLVSW